MADTSIRDAARAAILAEIVTENRGIDAATYAPLGSRAEAWLLDTAARHLGQVGTPLPAPFNRPPRQELLLAAAHILAAIENMDGTRDAASRAVIVAQLVAARSNFERLTNGGLPFFSLSQLTSLAVTPLEARLTALRKAWMPPRSDAPSPRQTLFQAAAYIVAAIENIDRTAAKEGAPHA